MYIVLGKTPLFDKEIDKHDEMKKQLLTIDMKYRNIAKALLEMKIQGKVNNCIVEMTTNPI